MPFEASSWTVISGTPGTRDPWELTYAPSRDIIVVGQRGPSLLVTWSPGDLYRSVDHGETWTLGWESDQEPDESGTLFYHPLRIGVLHDYVTGIETFVALIARVDHALGTPFDVTLLVYTSEDGAVWTRRQALVHAATIPFAAATFDASTFASRRITGGGTEHCIFVRAEGIALERGLYVSQDNGASWVFRSDPGDFGRALIVHPDERTLLVSGLLSGLAVARSEDGGVTWLSTSGNFGQGAAIGSDLVMFGGGPGLCMKQGTLGSPPSTRVSCDDGRSWPPGQDGPPVGRGNTAVTGRPVICRLSATTWECLLLSAGNTPGVTEVVYSDDGGETARSTAFVDSGTGTLQFTAGCILLNDGRPVFVTFTHGVFRSSDVAQQTFGARIYCVTAPAPGVGVAGFPEPCGDFYNPCPQECPADPPAAEGLVVPIPVATVLGDSWPFGDEELTYGADEAIFGGDPNSLFVFPVLGLPEGCGHTFANNPCASEACPV